jgi:hypothetical protein
MPSLERAQELPTHFSAVTARYVLLFTGLNTNVSLRDADQLLLHEKARAAQKSGANYPLVGGSFRTRLFHTRRIALKGTIANASRMRWLVTPVGSTLLVG